MKLLYAAGNRKNGKIQLTRFLSAIYSAVEERLQIKVAGFNKSCPGLHLDWTLDALQNMFDTSHVSFDNDNLRIYCQQVKDYKPDLIISDLELYTSYIGNHLNIPVWQVSPSLLYYGMEQQEKIKINIYRHYSYLFNRQNVNDDILQNILVNSDKKFVYSHFGDASNIKLLKGYEWLRPYHISGHESIPCQHNICATALQNDKKYIGYLKSFQDVVLFSDNLKESYPGIKLKDILNLPEYACNLKNCDLGATQGETDFLADLFYAGKYSLIIPDFTQSECILNALITEYFGLGKIIYQKNDTFNKINIIPKQNSDIEFLDDKVRLINE